MTINPTSTNNNLTQGIQSNNSQNTIKEIPTANNLAKSRSQALKEVIVRDSLCKEYKEK